MVNLDILILVRWVVTVVWVIYTGRGLWKSVNNLKEAKKRKADFQQLYPMKNGATLMLATGDIDIQRAHTKALTMAFLLGLAASVSLLPFSPDELRVFGGVVTTVGLLVMVHYVVQAQEKKGYWAHRVINKITRGKV